MAGAWGSLTTMRLRALTGTAYLGVCFTHIYEV